MRIVRGVVIVLLGVAIPYWVSSTIPEATIQRDSGSAVLGLLITLGLVLGVENRDWVAVHLFKRPREAWERWDGPRPEPSETETLDPTAILTALQGLTFAQESRYVDSNLRNKWVILDGLVDRVEIEPVPVVAFSSEVREPRPFPDVPVRRSIGIDLVFEARLKERLIELPKNGSIRVQGRVVGLRRNQLGYPRVVIGWCRPVAETEASKP